MAFPIAGYKTEGPTFEVLKDGTVPGLHNLPATITCNGVTVEPMLRYKLIDANTANLVPWDYGETLTYAAIGTPSTYFPPIEFNRPTMGMGPYDRSVKFDNCHYYQASNTTFADVNLEDMIIEAVVRYQVGQGGYRNIFGKELVTAATSGDTGWTLWAYPGYHTWTLRNLTSTANMFTTTYVVDCWYHILAYINRDDNSTYGMNLFPNGSANTGANPIAIVDKNLANIRPFNLAALGNGGGTYNGGPWGGDIAYVAAWKRDNWLASGAAGQAEVLAIARERLARLAGYWPSVGKGTKVAVTAGRVSVAFLEKYNLDTEVRDLHRVGPHLLRYCSRKDRNNTIVSGLLIENTNIAFLAYTDCFLVDSVGWQMTTSGDSFGQLLYDGDMEASGVDAHWVPDGTAYGTLSKETATPHTGTQYLRYTCGSNGNYPMHKQEDILTIGQWYRLTGWARGDLAGGPWAIVYLGNQGAGSNDGSTTWKLFNALGYASGTKIALRNNGGPVNRYVEFDDLIVRPSYLSPSNEYDATSFIANSSDGDHGLTQLSGTLTATQYTFSIFAKVGNKNWIYLANDTVANATCYFDLANIAVGTAGAGCVGYIEDYGNGWRRCCIVFTATAAAHTVRFQIADADGDKTVTGDGTTINTYIWCAQLEKNDYMSSPVTNPSSNKNGASRYQDILRYKGDDGNLGGVGSDLQGTVMYDILLPNHIGYQTRCVLDIIDNPAVNQSDHIIEDIAPSALRSYVRSTGGTSGDVQSTTSLVDGYLHRLRQTWKTNETKLYIDGNLEATDTTVAIPDNLEAIYLGGSAWITTYDGSLGALAGLIKNFRIYKIPTTK